jgi:hypothetical protein
LLPKLLPLKGPQGLKFLLLLLLDPSQASTFLGKYWSIGPVHAIGSRILRLGPDPFKI